MIDTSSPELLADPLGRSEAEVGNSDPQAVIVAKDVFGFQVTVVNAEGMTVLDRINELQENVFDKAVFSKVPTVVENLGEEVSVGSVFHDEERMVVSLDDAVQSDDTWVG